MLVSSVTASLRYVDGKTVGAVSYAVDVRCRQRRYALTAEWNRDLRRERVSTRALQAFSVVSRSTKKASEWIGRMLCSLWRRNPGCQDCRCSILSAFRIVTRTIRKKDENELTPVKGFLGFFNWGAGCNRSGAADLDQAAVTLICV